MTTIILLLSLIALLIVALCLSIYFNVRLGRMILSIEDQVEESLDILDKNYSNFAEIAAMPVFSDEPIIRRIMQNIREVRDAVLLVANKLVRFEGADKKEDSENK